MIVEGVGSGFVIGSRDAGVTPVLFGLRGSLRMKEMSK